MLLPVVGVIQAGGQAHADRYTYLPQIGIYLAVTWLVAECPLSRAALGALMTAVLAVLMLCACQQTAYWQNSETLWTHTLACTTDNFAAHSNLGIALGQQGRLDEAIAQYQTALQLQPGDADNRINLGAALRQEGRVDDAIAQYQLALQIKPANAGLHSNLGNALLQKGRPAEALPHYQQALQIEPANANFLNNLAWLRATCADASLRDGHKAVELARRANELSGGADPAILRTLAAAFAEAGRFGDAARAAQKAVALARLAGRQDLVDELAAQLQRYESGLSWRQ
jgi:tetratricopeptide (TPR) repeat protein